MQIVICLVIPSEERVEGSQWGSAIFDFPISERHILGRIESQLGYEQIFPPGISPGDQLVLLLPPNYINFFGKSILAWLGGQSGQGPDGSQAGK